METPNEKFDEKTQLLIFRNITGLQVQFIDYTIRDRCNNITFLAFAVDNKGKDSRMTSLLNSEEELMSCRHMESDET